MLILNFGTLSRLFLWCLASSSFICYSLNIPSTVAFSLQYFHFLSLCSSYYKTMLYVHCRTYRLKRYTCSTCHSCWRNITYIVLVHKSWFTELPRRDNSKYISILGLYNLQRQRITREKSPRAKGQVEGWLTPWCQRHCLTNWEISCLFLSRRPCWWIYYNNCWPNQLETPMD